MGQAFDQEGNVLGEAYGNTKRDVFDKLMTEHPHAHEVRIRHVSGHLEGASGEASIEMPRYKCHKEVWALKIAAVLDPTERGNESDGSRILRFVEADLYAPLRVGHAYVRKHDPKPGGYYVVYKDGYDSFSPAEAFEDGYIKV